MEQAELGALLRSYRTRAALTQEGLAELAEVSRRALSDIERGRIKWPQHRTCEALATALRLSGDERVEFLNAARSGKLSDPSPPPTLTAAPSSFPPLVANFVGREGVLAELSRLAAGGGGTAVLHGPAGTGKTAVALQFGQLSTDLFPDGRLFVPATDRMAALEALGLPASDGDHSTVVEAALHGRRMLLVFDDVAATADVWTAPGCLTLVTSRRPRTADLTLRIGMLPEAGELFESIIGHDRFAAEPEAAAEIVRLCGALPVAVRTAANRLVSRPGWPIAYLAARLRDPQRGIRLLTGSDPRLAAAFEAMIAEVSGDAAELFLAGEAGRASSSVHEELVRAGLVVPLPDGGVEEFQLARAHLIDAQRAGPDSAEHKWAG